MLNGKLDLKANNCFQLDRAMAVKARNQPIFGGSQIERNPDE
ncbi:hypothetical protein [Thermoflexibacter ruber]|uniref:Uncharacterized protein n=1 Tax=Thermoflexibacter ruber TaxID=1003 RepID=A0A1I2JQ75_9BACT|nr:hypothetical protein [Thermoflexibacter ruber]SFF56070.1 hypothetical protein SAMN04488541_10584 [Thermoflexibacter ruber]